MDIVLDEKQLKIIFDIEEELLNDTVGIPITLFEGLEEEATALWELLEKAKEAVV